MLKNKVILDVAKTQNLKQKEQKINTQKIQHTLAANNVSFQLIIQQAKLPQLPHAKSFPSYWRSSYMKRMELEKLTMIYRNLAVQQINVQQSRPNKL